ncbi:MAG: SDR family oxidoreductase [Chloroflexi bacterium]|nr:SDR family oxidoreductase [Chloroflexota bacterium]MCC6896844.1 SDR family oxidoreductase [Anaerolineae bacterium]
MTSILITGAAKGIGRATALHLDKLGFTVIAGVRSAADADSLRQAASPRFHTLQLDITHDDHIAALHDAVAAIVGSGGLDGLVNNAGVAVAAPLEFVPITEFRRQIEVNLTAQLAVIQTVLPLLRQAKGRIINVSSIGGRIAGPMLGAYHASKFALEGLTDSLRQELAPWGLQVVSIEPGAIATPIWDSGTQTADRLQAQMSPQAQTYYAAAFEWARNFAKTSTAKGLPPERVAEVITTALTAAQPRTRYPVGRDAQIGTHIIARLPDRLRDRLMAARG